MNIKKQRKQQSVKSAKNDFDAVRKALNDKLYDALAEYMKGLGFDLNEISEYSVIDILKADDGRIVVEVRAELDYEDLEGLLNVLDPIIQKYDPASYFEPVTPGIAEAYIDLDFKEESRDWLDDVADALYKYEGTVVSNDGTTITIEFDSSRMLNKFADALNLESHSISDMDGSYVAYVPVTKVESARSVESSESADSSIYDNREVVTRNGHKYAVRYTSIDTSPEADSRDMFDQFKFSISRLSPYDDAEYAWCEGEQGVVKCYRSGKLVNKTFYMDADDMDVESYEWCDEVIEESILMLEQMNHSIEPKIIHTSQYAISDASSDGYVYTNCAYCGAKNRVKVHFPSYGEPFEKTTFDCSRCGETNILVDPHKYDSEGNVEECANIESASYGGAYDIEDDQYFTRDDLVEFGENVCDNLNEIFYDKFDIYDIYMEDPKTLHIEVERKSDEMVAEYEFKIDMRKIRQPKDLISRYAGDVVYNFRQQFEEYPVESATDINAGIYDYPEPPLDPPEPKEYDEVEETEYVETSWDNLTVTVDTDGFWEYENEDWAKSNDDDAGNWHSYERYSIVFRDPDSVVEDIDELVEPYIPRQSGVYKISADFTLQYDITGLYADREYYPDGSYDEEIFDDDMEVTLNRSKSEIKNFKATKIS